MEYSCYFDLISDEYHKIASNIPYMPPHSRAKLWSKLCKKYIPSIPSPYSLNAIVLEHISILSENFNDIDEMIVLYNLNKIDDYPNMSKYQLSLSKKALAECYEKYGYYGSALYFYESGLADNKNLSVKKKISRLKKLPQEELVYSIDPNVVLDNPVGLSSQEQESTSLESKPMIKDEIDPAFDEYINNELNSLGPEYVKGFHELLAQREFSKDYFFSYKEWAEMELETLKESHKFSKKHQKAIGTVDLDALKNIKYDFSIVLSNEEILLLSKIVNKKALEYIPGYFTHTYHMNYQDALYRLIASGSMQFADTTYKIQKLTINELKAILSRKNIVGKGKKNTFVQLVIDNFNEEELSDLPDYFVATESGKKLLLDNQQLLDDYNAGIKTTT